MPGRDGKGPESQGPMTGRGMGRCGPGDQPGPTYGPASGRGRNNGQNSGQGTGRGLGQRIAAGFNNLRQRTRIRKSRRRSSRQNTT